MVDVIHWCLELGVRYISVYAFSIDNFQRSPDEVGALMHLAEEKYRELAAVGG
jgi:ditrans,polycis-polyprenyl diphosphate synthase